MNTSLKVEHPWQEKGVTYRAKYFSKLGLILISIVLTFSVGGIFLGLSYFLDTPPKLRPEGMLTLLISILITGLAIFALIKVIRTMRSSIRFEPVYEDIPPSQAGFPFEVWYQKPFQQEMENELITVCFNTNNFVFTGLLENTVEGSIYLHASSFEKNAISELAVPYECITDLNLKGRCISFKINGNFPIRGRIVFFVSEVDGERIYREFDLHFPAVPSLVQP